MKLLLPEAEKVVFRNPPLKQIIIQLRFPTILSINTKEPDVFQEDVRKLFPIYNVQLQQEQQIALNANNVMPQILKASANKIHQFISEDEHWRIHITNTFIAFSSTNYHDWESYIKYFKSAMDSFITNYELAFYSRIGLRCINVFSRSHLNLDETLKWSELIHPSLIGLFTATDIEENNLVMNKVEAELKLDDDNSLVKINAGIGTVNDTEERQYIIDSDFYKPIKTKIGEELSTLNSLHNYSKRLLKGMVKPNLYNAMGPEKK